MTQQRNRIAPRHPRPVAPVGEATMRKRTAVAKYHGHMQAAFRAEQDWLDDDPGSPQEWDHYQSMNRHLSNAIGWASRD